MTFIGKITHITAVENINWLTKRTVIVEATDKNQLAIDFLGDNTQLLDKVKEGDTVSIDYSTRVNFSWKFFNRITGKAITPLT